MSLTHQPTTATEQQQRSTRELVEALQTSYAAGEPYDDTVVWELANRALEAAEPLPATARVEGPRVVDSF